MRRRRASRREGNSPILGHIDLVAFSLFLALVIVGWLMVFSVGFEEFRNMEEGSFLSTSAGKQAIWIGICGLIFAFIMLFDWKFWQTFAYPIYAVSLGMLVLVLFFGANIKGATSWFSFGGFSFQPSEIAKFGTALALSGFLSSYSTDLKNLRSQFISLMIILGPIILILLQPDAGSALVFLSFFIVLFREGLNPSYYIVAGVMAALLIAGLVAEPEKIALALSLLVLLAMSYSLKSKRRLYWVLGAAAVAGASYYLARLDYLPYVLISCLLAVIVLGYVLYQQRNGRLVAGLLFFLLAGSSLAFAANYAFNNVLKPHQQDRINVWLQPEKCDERGSLYNLVQSKTAIGAGGLQGKGFLKGTMTKGNYVPEQSTDFIFCTIGEEQGFIGTFGIIVLFLLLLFRVSIIAERQRYSFSRHYAYCVAGIIFIHFFINIGMTMGLMPIIGIPLPFISKGGSSLMGFTIMIAVMLKLDKHRFRI
ncbi:MAG: rod shape-determining protein RodA [Phaeodactylibacter sp.]|nr:rod shape-determining protein RodA [Phaeodactylibacter sp.]MCB9263876.1 rod shape-determining protein RodA [Lewinellaceae bacterium]MCB9288198.1 rod shape-determining protein RodA [Lewinellaceae bacterium]